MPLWLLAETLIFAGNGFRCPPTQVAERLGDGAASVTDIYLPRWFAHNLRAIHVPVGLAGFLPARNLRACAAPAVAGRPASEEGGKGRPGPLREARPLQSKGKHTMASATANAIHGAATIKSLPVI